MSNYDFTAQRLSMVQNQLIARGIKDQKVLDAMSKVPRHLFIPNTMHEYAYEDSPLPIGYGQTISQPFIVALMTQAATLTPNSKVLEIGTGSGYQTAILSLLCKKVYTIEIIEDLAKNAQQILHKLGYNNISLLIGNGYLGWCKHAPFDAIITTAAPIKLPKTLISQLKVGGNLIIPIGKIDQTLLRIIRHKDSISKETLLPVRFVPMVEKI
jgi:protein-L-isoaspartate(D-aspartate) O-methyltransferase